jgi:hypothetical protein
MTDWIKRRGVAPLAMALTLSVAARGAANGTGARLTECTGTPSLDRLEDWLASGKGTTMPAMGMRFRGVPMHCKKTERNRRPTVSSL